MFLFCFLFINMCVKTGNKSDNIKMYKYEKNGFGIK